MSSLRDRLQSFRTAQSKANKQPAYCVFTNKVLDALCEEVPTTLVALGRVKGVGPSMLSKIGDELIKITTGGTGVASAAAAAPARVKRAPAAAAEPSALSLAFFAPKPKKAKGESSSSRPAPPAGPPPPKRSDLNAEQLRAADMVVVDGSNVFISGSAGTGKSFLTKYCIHELKKKHGDDAVAVTAPTGIAAQHVGGVTIHSWSGIGLGKGHPGALAAKVAKQGPATARWTAAKVLVIDEVSMLDSELFEALDGIARAVRNVDAPFGGIQLVAVGDFFQLPPVGLGGPYNKGFAFEARAWERAGLSPLRPGCVVLETCVRQQNDRAFVGLLNEIREGDMSAATRRRLDDCHVSRKPPPTDAIVPTKLYCTNRNVDEENARRLGALPGAHVDVAAHDVWKGPAPNADARKQCNDKADKSNAPPTLRLKVGAQVILLKNMPDLGLVNGSRGVVKSFAPTDVVIKELRLSQFPCPVVEFANGVVHRVAPVSGWYPANSSNAALVRTQLPLRLAWALTVHKSQGMTLERLQVELAGAFEFGQSYVALSRATSLEGLWLNGPPLRPDSVKAHPAVKQFYDAHKRRQSRDRSFAPAAAAPPPPAPSFAPASAAAAPPKPVITAEMRERMRLNKEAALARRSAANARNSGASSRSSTEPQPAAAPQPTPPKQQQGVGRALPWSGSAPPADDADDWA